MARSLAMMEMARFDAEAGAVDLASPRFEVVGTDVPVTRIPLRPLAAEPQGLDFGAA